MSVAALYRYPLKSAQGESLPEAVVETGGLRGDRTWACLDDADGTVGSAKHPRRWGRLLGVGTSLGSALTLRVQGRDVLAGSADADLALSDLLGRPVRLGREVPPNARLHRQLPDEDGMVPEWMAGVGAGQETVTDLSAGKRFLDFADVHIVTTGALAALAASLGRPSVPAARFRPNIVFDAPADPAPGTELRLGEAVLRVISPTPRCAVPGIADPDQLVDRDLLGTLARHHRLTLPGLGRAACFGVYAEVLQPGRLRVGEGLT